MLSVTCMKGLCHGEISPMLQEDDDVKADIPSMVYTNFRVNFWVLAILQSKTIDHRKKQIYELLKYWLSVLRIQ